MPHNTDRILTTHVGSLIRPPKLIEFWRAIEDGKPYDEAAFEACLTESVAEVVRQQAEVGVDIVSDGEFSKGRNWAFYVHDRLTGVAIRVLSASWPSNFVSTIRRLQSGVTLPTPAWVDVSWKRRIRSTPVRKWKSACGCRMERSG